MHFLKKLAKGTIVRVDNYKTIDAFILNTGYTWLGREGAYKVGDVVIVTPSSMGNVTITKEHV